MKNFATLSSLILTLLFFTSCSKLTNEYYLTPEMKAQIPFQGFETISFINDSANIINLIAENRQNKIDETFECINCKDYYTSEIESIVLKNNLYSISLTMGASKNSAFYIDFKYGEEGFSCAYTSLPLAKLTLQNGQMFYDSIVVNNKTYSDVFADTITHTGKIQSDPYPTYCYYSTEYGVIKIDFSNETSWELEKIEW